MSPACARLQLQAGDQAARHGQNDEVDAARRRLSALYRGTSGVQPPRSLRRHPTATPFAPPINQTRFHTTSAKSSPVSYLPNRGRSAWRRNCLQANSGGDMLGTTPVWTSPNARNAEDRISESRAALEVSRREVQHLADWLLTAHEDERRRLARVARRPHAAARASRH